MTAQGRLRDHSREDSPQRHKEKPKNLNELFFSLCVFVPLW
jgi:hypothetical protein